MKNPPLEIRWGYEHKMNNFKTEKKAKKNEIKMYEEYKNANRENLKSEIATFNLGLIDSRKLILESLGK